MPAKPNALRIFYGMKTFSIAIVFALAVIWGSIFNQVAFTANARIHFLIIRNLSIGFVVVKQQKFL